LFFADDDPAINSAHRGSHSTSDLVYGSLNHNRIVVFIAIAFFQTELLESFKE
jgi:hypothetical protein